MQKTNREVVMFNRLTEEEQQHLDRMLFKAIQDDHTEYALKLLTFGAGANARNVCMETPLIHAARHTDNPVIAEALLLHGAHVDDADAHGDTAMHHAAIAGHAHIALALSRAGASGERREASAGHTPMHMAAQSGNINMLSLIYRGAHGATLLNQQDKHGDTPLHIAMRAGQAEAVEWLVETGADLTVTNVRGIAPLNDLAAFYQNPESYLQRTIYRT